MYERNQTNFQKSTLETFSQNTNLNYKYTKKKQVFFSNVVA